MDSRPRAQCPRCPKILTTLNNGRLPLHGSMKDPCRGSRRSTTGWGQVETPDGTVLVQPKHE